MNKMHKRDLALNISALAATIASCAFAILSWASPESLNRVTSGVLGPVEADGPIRAEYVSGQVWLFLAACLIAVVTVGLAWAGFSNLCAALKASAIAAGRETKSWTVWLVIVPIAIPLTLGLALPRAIFRPTSLVNLQEQFPPGAWALNSYLGGLFLGVALLVLCWGLSRLILWLGELLRSVRRRQYQRIMENS
jgi:hypothetical protein